ncbi:hypothetical protein [Methanosarcina lacustris]|nr:hypothetical protein [Methanosarcina lacustris]
MVDIFSIKASSTAIEFVYIWYAGGLKRSAAREKKELEMQFTNISE